MVQVSVAPENGTAGPHVVDRDEGAGLTFVVMLAVVAGVAPFAACVTVTVKTCWCPISLVAVFGVIAIEASGCEFWKVTLFEHVAGETPVRSIVWELLSVSV